MLQRKFRQRVAAMNVEFGADVIPMVFNGAHADAELVGNLAAGQIFGDELEYATFGWRERVETVNRTWIVLKLF